MEKALYGLEGVANVKVFFDEKKVLVDYQKGRISEKQMITTLEKEGYRAEILPQKKNTEKN